MKHRIKTRARSEAIKRQKDSGVPYDQGQWTAFATGFNIGWKMRNKKTSALEKAWEESLPKNKSRPMTTGNLKIIPMNIDLEEEKEE